MNSTLTKLVANRTVNNVIKELKHFNIVPRNYTLESDDVAYINTVFKLASSNSTSFLEMTQVVKDFTDLVGNHLFYKNYSSSLAFSGEMEGEYLILDLPVILPLEGFKLVYVRAINLLTNELLCTPFKSDLIHKDRGGHFKISDFNHFSRHILLKEINNYDR